MHWRDLDRPSRPPSRSVWSAPACWRYRGPPAIQNLQPSRSATRRLLCSILFVLAAALHTFAADWQSGDGYRSRELSLPASGKTYLQRLDPALTGIYFTNVLSEEKALENSLRTGGSGVAAGDVDGDG